MLMNTAQPWRSAAASTLAMPSDVALHHSDRVGLKGVRAVRREMKDPFGSRNREGALHVLACWLYPR